MAAGLSSRFGSHKLLHRTADGRTIIERSLASTSGLDPRDLWIVTGYRADNLAASLENFQQLTVSNYDLGLGHSIAGAVSQLLETERHYDALMIVLADQVALRPNTVGDFTAEYLRAEDWTAVQSACYESANGRVNVPPVIFPRRDFAALQTLEGDRGGSSLVKAAAGEGRLRTILLPEAAIDIDTPADLETLDPKI